MMNEIITNKNIKVAIAHYWFVTWRGGEKVVKAILDLFPNADIYTLFYEPATCGEHIGNHKVYSSILDKPFLRKKYQKIFPLYPIGVKSLKLNDDYDLIISSESGPIKGIANPNHIPHLCYIHTPMRYCWGFTQDYLDVLPGRIRPFAKLGFENLRRYDETTVKGVDKFVANSNNVAKRVKDFYHRDASVIYPPISLNLFRDDNLAQSKSSDREYYLSFGAITPYKAIGLLVDAFNANGKKLVVIGEGSERKRLEAKANSNIQFLGALPDKQIQEYILGAKALLFPGEEDFGMIPLEVMAHGVPVIAYGKGGALETVLENESDVSKSTGLFFHQQNVDALIEKIQYFDTIQNEFDPVFLRNHARKFGEDHFKDSISNEILNLLSDNRKNRN